MPWARLDDRANDNPKLRLLSDSAYRLWVCGLVYCQAHLTDGFIPSGMIGEFGVKAKNLAALAEELCSVLVPGKGPLWVKVDGGYQVHDYLDINPSRDEVLRDRDKAKKRLSKHRNNASAPVTNAVVNAAHSAICAVADTPLRRVSPTVSPPVETQLKRRFNTVSAGVANADDTPLLRLSTTTYHDRTCTNQDLLSVRSTSEKQERESSSLAHPVEAVENAQSGPDPRVLLNRRRRSKETADGKPAVHVITALARDILLRHRGEDDDGELREILKRACAKANLRYDGPSVSVGLERARSQLKRGVR